MVTRSSIPVQIRRSISTTAWSGAMRPAASAALWLRESMRLQRSLPRRAGAAICFPTHRIPRTSFNEACPEGQDAASGLPGAFAGGGASTKPAPKGRMRLVDGVCGYDVVDASTKPAPKGRMRLRRSRRC